MALTEMVIMPGEDYQAICDSVRAKTGRTELLKSGDVASAINGIVSNGTGVDMSDATATASDIAYGKIAYSNNGRIVGTIEEVDSGEGYSFPSTNKGFYNRNNNKYFYADVLMTDKKIWKKDSFATVEIEASELGNATTSDVVAGKTFTSENGLKIVGTNSGATGGTDNSEFIKMVERSSSNIAIPYGCTTVGDYAFYYYGSLTSVNLPDTISTIGYRSFYQCSNLAIDKFPTGLTKIDTQAFYNCRGLTSITFKSTPTSIANNAFGTCINIITINVPWAQGAVAGAPWGATNATINYNYVE